jgi:glycosyltransferase involved in cell wall biosynthesis
VVDPDLIEKEHDGTHGRRSQVDLRGMRVLAFAYACEPGKGSEPGAGWMWARILAGLGETWVITRRDYAAAIEAALGSTPERDNLRFVYVELPERLRGWQRGLHGLRSYYLLWQILALLEAGRLRRTLDFDVVWHLTWATAWFGSFAAFAGRPFVFGPVGGCVRAPWRLVPSLGWRGALHEGARILAMGGGRFLNPLSRLSWRRADLIFAQNVETRGWFPRSHRDKTRVFPNSVIPEGIGSAGTSAARTGAPTALFAGRLEPWKGVFLCLHTLALLPEWRLVVCGTGSDHGRMQQLAARLRVADRVEWLGWVSRDEVLRQMGDADVFLFPSLHEDAGMVIAEASAMGLPPVCLDRGGPVLLTDASGVCVSAAGSPSDIARRLADAAAACLDRRTSPSARRSGPQAHGLDRTVEDVREILREVLDDSITHVDGDGV